LIEGKESLSEMEELSKDEDLDKVSMDEREMGHERKASLAFFSMARFMMRERKLSTEEGVPTCFKNIWRLRCRSLRDMSLTSCNSCNDKDLVLFFSCCWEGFILLRWMLLALGNVVGDDWDEIKQNL
jgi:hypothetical protein